MEMDDRINEGILENEIVKNLTTERINLIDSEDRVSIGTKISRNKVPFKIKTFNIVYKVWNTWRNFRLKGLNKKLEKKQDEFVNSVFKADSSTGISVSSSKIIKRDATKIANLEKKIKVLKKEDVPTHYVSHRAVGLSTKMHENLVYSSEGLYRIIDEDIKENFFEPAKPIKIEETPVEEQVEKTDAPEVQEEVMATNNSDNKESSLSAEDIRNLMDSQLSTLHLTSGSEKSNESKKAEEEPIEDKSVTTPSIDSEMHENTTDEKKEGITEVFVDSNDTNNDMNPEQEESQSNIHIGTPENDINAAKFDFFSTEDDRDEQSIVDGDKKEPESAHEEDTQAEEVENDTSNRVWVPLTDDQIKKMREDLNKNYVDSYKQSLEQKEEKTSSEETGLKDDTESREEPIVTPERNVDVEAEKTEEVDSKQVINESTSVIEDAINTTYSIEDLEAIKRDVEASHRRTKKAEEQQRKTKLQWEESAREISKSEEKERESDQYLNQLMTELKKRLKANNEYAEAVEEDCRFNEDKARKAEEEQEAIDRRIAENQAAAKELEDLLASFNPSDDVTSSNKMR